MQTPQQFSETIEISSTVHSPAQRILELDGLRGIAIAMVLMRHYVHHPSLLLLGPQWGWMGINLALRNYLPHSVALVLGLAAALGISALSWRFFEGPIARWKQHAFRYPMASQPEVPC